MTFDQLAYFVKLADSEHMSHTADELHLSQSSLSSHIQRLESELGHQLFSRKGKRLHLNAHGKAFLPYAVQMLETEASARDALSQVSAARERNVVISAPQISSFPGLYEKLNASCSDINILNISRSAAEWKSMLLSSELDFCITGLPVRSDELEEEILSQDELVVIAGSRHALCHLSTSPLAAFAQESFCDYGRPREADSNLQKFCREAGFEPHISAYVHSINDVFSIVASTNMVGLIPARIIKTYAAGTSVHVCRLTSPACFSNLFLYRKKNAKLRPSAQKVCQVYLDYFLRGNK